MALVDAKCPNCCDGLKIDNDSETQNYEFDLRPSFYFESHT